MPPRGPPPPDGDVLGGTPIVVIQSMFIAIATMLIALRFYVRKISHALGLDDFFIVFALVWCWAFYAVNIIMVDNGSGRHIYYLSQTQLEIYAKAVTVGLWIIGPATACSRISIAIFLLRVVNPGRRWRIFLYGLIIFMGVTFVAQSISSIFRCVPVQKQWDSSAPGTCWSGEASHAFDFWQGIYSTICDFTLALIPIMFLWNVQISWKRKIGVCVIMGIGVITGVFAILRTVAAWNLPLDDLDPTSRLEEHLLLIGASIPAIAPFFKTISRNNGKPKYVPDHDGCGAKKLVSTRNLLDAYSSKRPYESATSESTPNMSRDQERIPDTIAMNDMYV